jgi:hypothetical protein
LVASDRVDCSGRGPSELNRLLVSIVPDVSITQPKIRKSNILKSKIREDLPINQAVFVVSEPCAGLASFDAQRL